MNHWHGLAAQVIGGGRWITAADVAQTAQAIAKQLLES